MIRKSADSPTPADAADPAQARWTIGELAQAFGLTTRALRHYEDEGLLHPSREGSARIYSQADHDRLQQIRRGKQAGFSLETIRELIAIRTECGDDAEHRRLFDQRCTERIAELESQHREIGQQLALLRDMLAGDGLLSER